MIHNKSARFFLISSECYEFLYIDDYARYPTKENEEKDEEGRGVIVIDLMSHENS